MDKESSNGYQTKRAVLYARVSTEEQAKSGYSLAQQLEALREYAAREGYEVLEEVVDPGQSGASLARPGMDRVRDLVAAEGVSMVLAQDRDRFAREPAYLYLLKQEFAEHGCKLKALNDRGDDSPEGELADGVLDLLAKFQRSQIARNSHRGKLRKAREGKIVAGHTPNYGFRYNETRDGYVVDEEQMAIVYRVFRMIGAEAMTIRGVKRTLEREGVPTPTGRRHWNKKTIRDIILDDLYKPHTFEEIAQFVSPEVVARLSPEKCYGIWWFNRRYTTVQQVVENDLDGRSYRRRHKEVLKPREEWIAVPVPDAGIPQEWVKSAREAVENNRRPSSTNGRFWELSGGIFVCGGCGRRMQPDRRRRSPDSKRFYYYYRCPTRQQVGKDACAQLRSYRAEETEMVVWRFVSKLLEDPDRLRTGLEKMIEEERNGSRGDPERETKAWLHKLAEVNRKRSAFQDMAAEGLITFEELRAKIADLDDIRKTAERELKALRGRAERVEALERDKEDLLASYANVVPETLMTLAPEDRHRVYKTLKLRVVARPDRALEANGAFGEWVGVCTSEPTPPCGRSPGPSPPSPR